MPQCQDGCSFKSKQSCDRFYHIGGKYDITITQSWHRKCIGLPGGAVWEGAVFMSEYVARKYEAKMKGAKVLELGSGPGLVGILCGKMGATVLITDHEDAIVDLVQQNITQNNLDKTVTAENLPWGTLCTETYDFIIGSEITYASEQWNELATTMASAANANCRIIISEGPRFLDDDERELGAEGFFEFLKEKSSKEFPFTLIKPIAPEPVPADVSQAAMDRWAKDGIVMWEMVRGKSKLRLPSLSFGKKKRNK